MRTLLINLFLLGAAHWGVTQSRQPLTEEPIPERRLLLGIDLTKTLAPTLSGQGNNYPLKKKVFFTIEPTLRIESATPRLFWVIQPGLTYFTEAPFGNALMNMTGSFMKLGVEYHITPINTVGLLLTTSGWKTDGAFTIPSQAFNAYQAPLPVKLGLAGGIEFQVSRSYQLGPTSMLRFLFRTNGFWRTRVTDSPETPYIPGLGRYIDLSDSSLSLTVGGTIEYYFYLRGRW